jgi:hypothetical protein
VSFGLGDLVVSLPAIQALVAKGDPVWLVARSPSQAGLAERIAGLAGVVSEDALAEAGRVEDRFIDLRDHPLQRDYWWGSPAFEAAHGEMGINEILATICTDFAIEADFDSPAPLSATHRPGLTSTVLLVHETDNPDKGWPADRWAAADRLLRAEGYLVAQVTRQRRPSPLADFGIPALVAPTPGDAVDALSGCLGVIGVDTGLTHLAAQQGIPTVTLCRRSSVYFRPWTHCRVVRGARCTDACTAAEADYAYHHQVSLRGFRPRPWACPSGAACLDAVRPEDAVARLRDLL